MKERPILMSGAMVRATLREVQPKTQTRRVVKLPHNNPLGQWEPTIIGGPDGGRTAAGETVPLQGGIWHTRTGTSLICPHGQPGDRLWVRETFQGPMWEEGTWDPDTDYNRPEFCEYRADGGPRPEYVDFEDNLHEGWKPSIHMPRWASRITLEVTGVRVERLQDISEEDALAEGIRQQICGWFSVPGIDGAGTTARAAFALLWNSLNAARGYGWDTNPWVWVIQFRRIKQ